MYESPIEKIYGDIQSQIIKQDEEHLMYAVNQSIGYTVDKEELIKALQYDRDQYTKGYRDCKIDMLAKIKQAMEEIENIGLCSYLEVVKEIECNNREVRLSKKFAIAILDKLISESEGVNADKTNI